MVFQSPIVVGRTLRKKPAEQRSLSTISPIMGEILRRLKYRRLSRIICQGMGTRNTAAAGGLKK
ncbi:MAG TPA: hypothetical protein VH643_21750 [Gemmataceae bacterium]